LDSYGQDPRRIAYAGSEVDGASVDYASKYKEAQQTIKDRYTDFGVEYRGKDNDDYVNGGGFCCDDAPALRAGAIGNGNDNPELYQYYYHSDHLGSTSLITNLDGEIVQHVEYVPFGEVFIEERNNTWNTPYLFNAKELDEETGLYYYGARYYDSRVSLWLSTDPLQEKYPGISPFCYTLQNPVNAVDPDGRSTHIDVDGNIIAVFDDKDLSVYQHQNNADGEKPTEYMLSKRQNKWGTSSGGKKIGETENWNEFVNPETGKAMTKTTIQVDKSFDPIIERMHEKAKDMNLVEIAQNSKGGKLFDIKNDYENIGALLNGKYATSRSAGNFLAGYNAESGTFLKMGITFEIFQKLAGALHIEESYGAKLSKRQMLDIIVLGNYISADPNKNDKFKAPNWGEVTYQYRMSKAGWEYGEKKGATK
jgi:RHS repeat-associated protein